ncbi:MAG TPA: protein kinase [Pilimelia sp.]|nr:protein kinase [Pilimelia sp.]
MSPAQSQVVADRYRLVEPLGQGGMGRVWMAVDELLHRDVAIKELIPPAGLTEDERQEMRERTLREARAIARFNHPNVVRIFDILRTNGDPWIVMEYVASRSLQDVIAEDGPLAPERVAEIGLGMLAALRAAHRAGVVHRDVKPGNVLLGNDGRVVLTDFGLATVPGDPVVTRTGLVLGSPAYIAPERAHDGTAGPEADMWSLGATLYAAVEGQSPYARPSAIATLAALATEQPAPARRAGPLKPVLNGLLRKDPTQRIDAEVAERLLRRSLGRRPRSSLGMLTSVRRPAADRPTAAMPTVPGDRQPKLPYARTPESTPTPAGGDGAVTAMLGGPPAAAHGMVVDRAEAVAAPPEPAPEAAGEVPTRAVPPPPRSGDADGVPAGPPPSVPPRPAPSWPRRARLRLAAGVQVAGLAAKAGARAGRRPAVLAAVMSVLVVLVVGWTVATWPEERPDRTSTPPSPRASASSAPTPEPTTQPSASTPEPEPTAAVPSGWSTFRGKGFSVAVPRGMLRQGNDDLPMFRENGGAWRFIRIERLDTTVTDPVAFWNSQIPRRLGSYPGHRLIDVRRVDFQRAAADWEFTYSGNHVVHRVFTTRSGRSYTMSWQAAEGKWASQKDGIEIMARTFRVF